MPTTDVWVHYAARNSCSPGRQSEEPADAPTISRCCVCEVRAAAAKSPRETPLPYTAATSPTQSMDRLMGHRSSPALGVPMKTVAQLSIATPLVAHAAGERERLFGKAQLGSRLLVGPGQHPQRGLLHFL
jgi:hypothetical protein